MRYLFDHLEAIRDALGLVPFGLITDIDGTISPIAASPQEARVSPACRQALAELVSRLALVAAISGRPASDARDMVGVDGMLYIGNHGLERWQGGEIIPADGAESYPQKVSAARQELERRLNIDGLHFEDKGMSLGIHYRNCSDSQAARQAILRAISDGQPASEFRVIEGKMVVELRPPLTADKGTVVGELLRSYQLKGGIYLGDDISDLDAFRAMQRQAGFLAIGVASEETPADVLREADYTLNGTGDTERFLRWLAAEAQAPGR